VLHTFRMLKMLYPKQGYIRYQTEQRMQELSTCILLYFIFIISLYLCITRNKCFIFLIF